MQPIRKWPKETEIRNYQQYCHSCGIPVGFTRQSPAYSDGENWLCEADNLKYQKKSYDQERYKDLSTHFSHNEVVVKSKDLYSSANANSHTQERIGEDLE